MRLLANKPVISTKTYAWSSESAKSSLDQARRALDLDVIDIVLLHEQESLLTMDGHREAFSYLLAQKEKGVVRAVGLSTHAIEPVLALAAAADPSADPESVWGDIDPGPYREADVVHPLIIGGLVCWTEPRLRWLWLVIAPMLPGWAFMA